MLRPGQKVVCIDDSPMRHGAAPYLPMRLVKDAVYTIRSIHVEDHLVGYGVRLEELLNPVHIWEGNMEVEWSYDHRRFRTVVDQDNDLKVVEYV